MFSVVHRAFHKPRTRLYKVVSGLVWFLIAVSMILLVAEPTTREFPELSEHLATVDRIILALFGIELSLRVLSYHPGELDVITHSPLRRLRIHIQRRVAFLLQPLNIVDLITILAVVPALRGLRALRFLRLLRAAPIFRYKNPFAALLYAFERDRLLFFFGFSVLGTEVALGGLSLYFIERGTNPGLTSLPDGIWFAIVTITTVGFGDITAFTPLGRLVSGALMVSGMITLALFAGIVGHSLLTAVLGMREEQFRMSDYINHVVVCGYDEQSYMLLQTLRQELDIEETRVVIFADRERPNDLAPDLLWVRGDPTKESELDKVRITHAAAVIVVGERSVPPQRADATTILTTFTVRSYLSKSDTERSKPLYILTEVLDAENVEHARTAGADEVIETYRLGFSMLAHSIKHPGTADAMSRVVIKGENNLYVGLPPKSLELPLPYSDVRVQVKAAHNALVVGLRSPTGDTINPADDIDVAADTHLIYLAEKPVLGEPV